jgi:hypothetical protein
MIEEAPVGTEQVAQNGQGIPVSPPAVARAEQLMTDWGHRVGFLLGTTRQRLQNVTGSIRDAADRLDQPVSEQQSTNGVSSTPSSTPPTQPAQSTQQTSTTPGQQTGELMTQRAERLVDDFAQRVSTFAAATGLQIRRASAFVREDAEDMWAEAQSIRNQRSNTSPANTTRTPPVQRS